ncbi:hypothetical protein QBC34DRAFT_412478 [Podospora aff. communis PSN243]|uniref:Uncharacterized protein n=1 Tax=Podospora aff. communis PSN243 TaxID=3040156 RepID=A0AAV9GAR7_9PEZI|nr:hypothetical protein QBC34DRAFT_412478 [Podospora aff. communis PSN243]
MMAIRRDLGSFQTLKAVVLDGGMTNRLCSPRTVSPQQGVGGSAGDRHQSTCSRVCKPSASATHSQRHGLRGRVWSMSVMRCVKPSPGMQFSFAIVSRESDGAEAGCVLMFDGSRGRLSLTAIMCARSPRAIYSAARRSRHMMRARQVWCGSGGGEVMRRCRTSDHLTGAVRRAYGFLVWFLGGRSGRGAGVSEVCEDVVADGCLA